MDITDALVLAASSTVVTAIVTTLINGVFGWAKGRADAKNTDASTAEIFNKIAADLALRDAARAERDDTRIKSLVAAIEHLTDAVDRVASAPLLQRLVVGDDAEVVDLNERLMAVKEANSAARLAI